MAGLPERSRESAGGVDVFDRLDRMFAEWTRSFPLLSRATEGRGRMMEEVIRVNEYHDNGTLVIEAEMPGIDPEKDATITVSENMLHIQAERRTESRTQEGGYLRQEMTEGTFRRSLPLPEGVSADDITAGYRDGILQIRVPVPQAQKPEPRKIAIDKG